MTAQAPMQREHGNAYNIFILVVTVFSLAVMALLVLPWLDEDTKALLRMYDNVVCFIFLVDFAYNLTGSRPTSTYFIHQRGWLDLLGSIPSFGLFQVTALLRLARLSRLARIARLLRGNNRRELVEDVLRNRGQYATFITLLSAGLVLSIASLLVLQFESQSPDANIKTSADAIWWGIVTITTVGYGDRYPVTLGGRLTAAGVMVAGIGIIGALASILASLLVSSPSDAKPEDDPEAAAAPSAQPDRPASEAAPARPEASAAPARVAPDALVEELARLRAEIGELRDAVGSRSPDPRLPADGH